MSEGIEEVSIPERNVVEKGWESYFRKVVPPGAGPVQIRETRQAWYASAVSLMYVIKKLSEVPEDDALGQLNLIMDELTRFAENLDQSGECQCPACELQRRFAQ